MDDGGTAPTGGGAVIRAGKVRVGGEAVRIGPAAEAAGPSEPKVHLVREDGTVRAIEVTCPCGRKVRILCEYA